MQSMIIGNMLPIRRALPLLVEATQIFQCDQTASREPLDEQIVDTSSNPGRWAFHDQYIEALGTRCGLANHSGI